MILLIDNYDSFTFNLVHRFGELGVECDVQRNDALSVDDALAGGHQAIVISPGPCTPTEAGISVDLVQAAPPTLPILGVCLGHQAIAAACGGEIVGADEILHGKVDTIQHHGQGVFAELPNPLEATRYHSLVVNRDDLPDCLEVVAETASGTIMGVAHRSRPVHGVQFHPESIATPCGHQLLDNFLRIARIKN